MLQQWLLFLEHTSSVKSHCWCSPSAEHNYGPARVLLHTSTFPVILDALVERYLLGKLKFNCNSMSYQAIEGSAVK